MRLALLLPALFLSACASRAKQTEDLRRDPPREIPSAARVENVPFIEQAANHCGPATLAMVMNWAGRGITADEIAPQVYNPSRQGSLQMDLISASRRHGLVAIPLSGMRDLLREVAAGHPVIVFENLAMSWLPQWHYAVVLGYDLPRREIILHSGPNAFQRWDMEKFERSWMLGDYWGLVVLPPGKMAASGDELAHVTAAAGLEQAGRLEEADLVYQSLLKRSPESLLALIGRGNVAYARDDARAAVAFLRQAVRHHPGSAAARHNLSVAENALRGNQAKAR
ncbi:MAG: PA2778 family cysteine peptidase [Bdellovibrionaceae bacterium]|nr:PA2778 family cysteine peptidase [Pseudobdellovibrionaceae bacterium]